MTRGLIKQGSSCIKNHISKNYVALIIIFSILVLIVASSNVPQAHATGTVSITITSSPSTGSGYVKVDGSNMVTPATFSWNIGETHTIEANSAIIIVPDESRYSYSGWSDGGAQSHTITVQSSETLNAIFQLQYYLNVSGGYLATGQGWYNNGTSATASSSFVESIEGNTTGLIGSWNFDDSTGSVAYDSSGNGNNGTIFGATTVPGKFGNALSFDGVTNCVQLNSVIHSPKTVSFWIKTSDSTDTQSVISTDNSEEYIYGIFNGKAFYGWHQGSGAWNEITSTASVATGVWVYVAFVYDSNDNMNIFINGMLDSTAQAYFGNSEKANFTQFGVSSYTLWGLHQMFKGSLDDVRIYNRTLDASEIQSLYNGRLAITNWQLDSVNQSSNFQNTVTLTTRPIVMDTYHSVNFLSATAYEVTIRVTDYFGNPVSGAKVTYTLVNGETVKSTTDSAGTLSMIVVPREFHANISFLGVNSEINGDASAQPSVTVKVLVSYITLSLIWAGIALVVAGFAIVRFYKRSPMLQVKIDRTLTFVLRKNCGLPFFVICVVLLFVTIVSLSVGGSSLASSVAIYAYYFLIVGAILQLTRFLKYRKRDAENE